MRGARRLEGKAAVVPIASEEAGNIAGQPLAVDCGQVTY